MKENDNRGGGQGKIARKTESKSYQYVCFVQYKYWEHL